PVARVGEVSLAVAEEDVHAVEVDAKGEIHLAVFIKVSGDNASVVQSVRPLDALPEFPVSLAVAEEDRGTVRPGALRRSDDVGEPVTIHVGDRQRVSPGTFLRKSLRRFHETDGTA